MSQPLDNRWTDEVVSHSVLKDSINSFDIWSGFDMKQRVKNKECKYLTLVYSTKTSLNEYVWGYPPTFLNQGDNNVDRILSASSPFVYKHSLISKKIPCFKRHVQKYNICDDKGWSIIVPVTKDVESRWKATVCFDISSDIENNPQNLIYKHHKDLSLMANNIYRMWLLFEGQNFNLYEIRGIFCSNAIQIARMMAEGFSTKRMAKSLDISCSGIEYHIESMKKQLGTSNRGSLIAELFRKGIIV